MVKISEIIAKAITPETKHHVAACLTTIQLEEIGTGIASIPVFDEIMLDLNKFERLIPTIDAIKVQMNTYCFFNTQMIRLAEFIIEKFGKKPVRVPEPVAMGGMPADDDEVVFVGTSKDTKIEDANKALMDAYKKLDGLTEECVKATKVVERTTTALKAATDENEHATRVVQTKATAVQNAQAAVKEAQDKLDEIYKENSEGVTRKRRRE